MRLIDADRRIEVLEGDKDIENAVNQYVSVQPTAYDIGKVVEDLEYEKKDVPEDKDYWSWVSAIDKAIEIVKQGGVANNRKDCEYRHDNGNCLKVGGFCTAVDNKHCEKLKQGGVYDDVCEWRIVDLPNNFPIYNTSCGKIKLQYATGVDIYCNGCGKKIKIVGD